MQENEALVSSKRKEFVKSLKGLKKLIKKNDDTSNPEKTKIGKRNRNPRGLIYLSHIPHGFYENEMTQYFKQFGAVTNVRVIRSKHTGNSKGYAFVEFKEPAVAEIAAETMHNYLMGKRLLKAKVIPPEEQKKFALRKRWNSTNNPGANYRIKMKKLYNEDKDKIGDLEKASKLLKNLNTTKRKLAEIGINYDFFEPVDVPKHLLVEKPIKKKNQGKDNCSSTQRVRDKA